MQITFNKIIEISLSKNWSSFLKKIDNDFWKYEIITDSNSVIVRWSILT
jgi:hypothetical protein